MLVNLRGVTSGVPSMLVMTVTHAQPLWLRRESAAFVPVPSMTVNCS